MSEEVHVPRDRIQALTWSFDLGASVEGNWYQWGIWYQNENDYVIYFDHF